MRLTVDVGDGAAMPLPDPAIEWAMRHGTLAALESHRMSAASIAAAYAYLVRECSKEEAWRRIKLIRKALIEE